MEKLKTIARIYTDLPSKFGVPRQSGLVSALRGVIVFEPEYRNDDALRGIEQFSHLWLIWGFSEVPESEEYSPTVRPPKLGGNERVGVFATRSPFRPNPIGLSCVKLEGTEKRKDSGTIIKVSGIDMMSGTPIYDIKPYIPYADSRIDAKGGFAQEHKDDIVPVIFPEELLNMIPEDKREALMGVLERDPRPAYKNDGGREYGMDFANFGIKFKVSAEALTVTDVIELK